MSGRYMYTYNRPVQVEFESITAPTRHETECGETEETKERKKEDETRRDERTNLRFHVAFSISIFISVVVVLYLY